MLLWKGGSDPVTIFFRYDGRSHAHVDTQETLDARRDSFAARLKVVKREQAGKLVVLNTLNVHHSGAASPQTGEMSYPNYAGPHKANHYPDLVVLARLAARAGADLRVLVLHRSAEDMLISTTVHRSFATTVSEAKILVKSAEALASQLHTLESDASMTDVSWLCVPFERIGEATWWSEPAVGLGAGEGATHARLARDTSAARSQWLHPWFTRGSAAFSAMLSALVGSEARHDEPTFEVARAAMELSFAENKVASAASC